LWGQANFRDAADTHQVPRSDGAALAEAHAQRRGGAYFAECSMRDGFGLKYIHRFLNVPFLHLQVRLGPQHMALACSRGLRSTGDPPSVPSWSGSWRTTSVS
jgi:hypothetical protein